VQDFELLRQKYGLHGVTPEEFKRLYVSERPLLVRQFRSRYRELADEVEDVVQDAFAKLWSSHGIDGQTLEIREAGKWVYRVVSNAMIDLARVRRSRPTVPLLEQALSPSPGEMAHRHETGLPMDLSACSPEDLAAADEFELDIERRRLAVTSALEQLNPVHRTLLVEFYVNGRSYVELAELTGISKSALGTTLLRARRNVLKIAQETRAGDSQPRLRVIE
jgi:RNA polymerase sigma factor (sigma-70 family)